MTRSSVDVVIVGAGPYGLSLASHLSDRGVERRIFGFPMRSWRQMPPTMNLKSFGFATSIPSLRPQHTLPEYCRTRGLEDFEPIAYSTFADYGTWFQQQLVPDIEQMQVADIARQGAGFAVRLDSGESVEARQVIIATGLGHFTKTPDVLSSLPSGAVTHAWNTAEYLSTTRYAGRDVTVIGAGQSALEAAALLHEGGAEVRILARHDVGWSNRFSKRSLRDRLLNPNTVVGPGRKNWVLQHLPWLPYYLPTERRVRLTRTYLGPFGAWWLRDRIEGKVPIVRHATLRAASMDKDHIALRIRAGADEQVIRTDHIIAATGYEANVDRLPFVGRDLAKDIRRVEDAPALSTSFESSVPGLYFVGPASAFSFGPLFRFVAGAAYTVPTVTRRVMRTLKHRSSGGSR
jgi:cation diffusion facilitator CzcD-associated flavoprotein CzcO